MCLHRRETIELKHEKFYFSNLLLSAYIYFTIQHIFVINTFILPVHICNVLFLYFSMHIIQNTSPWPEKVISKTICQMMQAIFFSTLSLKYNNKQLLTTFNII